MKNMFSIFSEGRGGEGEGRGAEGRVYGAGINGFTEVFMVGAGTGITHNL